MERQLPKNVRQIGNVCDEPKIYVEDYVDTFLGQLQEKAMEILGRHFTRLPDGSWQGKTQYHSGIVWWTPV